MAADDLAIFGNWLKQRREALDFTQKELAREVSCSLSTLRKLEAASTKVPAPATVGPAEAHLFIVNPLRGRRSGGSFTSLFMTHPPTARRIERLEHIAANPR